MQRSPYRAPGSVPPPPPDRPTPRPSLLRVLGWIVLIASLIVTVAAWVRCVTDIQWAFAGACSPRASRLAGQIAWAGYCAKWTGIIAFLRWVYGAAANVIRAGRRLSHAPGQCVLWMLIPIAQLVMGYRIVSEIAAVSEPPNPSKMQSNIFVWWLMWCAAAILDLVRSYAASHATDNPGVFRNGIVLEAVRCIFLTISLVAFASFIDKLARSQERLLAEIAGG